MDRALQAINSLHSLKDTIPAWIAQSPASYEEGKYAFAVPCCVTNRYCSLSVAGRVDSIARGAWTAIVRLEPRNPSRGTDQFAAHPSQHPSSF